MTGSVILGCLSWFVLWLLIFQCWGSLRTDLFRQKLFAIRNELFLLGAEGAVGFEHQAYAELRMRINAVIRFAHTATLLRITCIAAVEATSPLVPVQALREEWERALASLPGQTADRFREIERSLTRATIEHAVLVPALLSLPLLVPFIAVQRARNLAKQRAELFQARAVEEFAVEHAATA